MATAIYLARHVPADAASSSGTTPSLSSSSWSPALTGRHEEAEYHDVTSLASAAAAASLLPGALERHEYEAGEEGYYDAGHLPPHADHPNDNEYTSVTIPPMHVCKRRLSSLISRIHHFIRRGQSFVRPGWSRKASATNDNNDDGLRAFPPTPTGDVQHVVSTFLAAVKYAALGVLLLETVLAVKDMVRDAWRDAAAVNARPADHDDGIATPLEEEGGWAGLGGRFGWGGGRPGVDPSTSSGHPPILSPTEVQKLVLWLGQPRHIRQTRPPPRIPAAPWMVSVAQDLDDSCPALTMREKYRILSQLSRPDASLLQACLLRHPSNGGVTTTNNDNDFTTADHPPMDRVGGLVKVKAAIRRWVQSATALQPQPSSTMSVSAATDPTKLSPYHKLVSGDSGGLQGMVLWGPPGCGKSLLLRSISQQSGLPTLVVTPSLIQRKWYGESNLRVRTLFGLIRTLGSCVVILDEVDGLFQTRRDDDQEAGRDLKTEWFQWWDGVVSSSSSAPSSSPSGSPQHKVLIVGATNRPWDVDPAAWRRLPHRLYVGLPNAEDRFDLLLKWTSDLPRLDPLVIKSLVASTEGYTPSDLLQVLKWACQVGPMARNDTNLTMEDVQRALAEIAPARFSARYVQELQQFMGCHPQTAGSTADSGRPGAMQPPSNGGTPRPSGEVDGYCWETPFGNFYQFQVHVDPDVLGTIQELYWNYIHDWDEKAFFDDSEFDPNDINADDDDNATDDDGDEM